MQKFAWPYYKLECPKFTDPWLTLQYDKTQNGKEHFLNCRFGAYAVFIKLGEVAWIWQQMYRSSRKYVFTHDMGLSPTQSAVLVLVLIHLRIQKVLINCIFLNIIPFDPSIWAQLWRGLEGTPGGVGGYMIPFLESSEYGKFGGTIGFWIWWNFSLQNFDFKKSVFFAKLVLFSHLPRFTKLLVTPEPKTIQSSNVPHLKALEMGFQGIVCWFLCDEYYLRYWLISNEN